jgi:hypothetical protein
MRKLQEKILLEEPEDSLPPVSPDKPIVVSTANPSVELTPTPTQNIPADVSTGAYTGALNDEIQSCYDDIERLKGLVATFTLDRPDDAVVSILNSILDERNMHIGMLQKAKDTIDPTPSKLVAAGEDKAKDIAKAATEAPKDESINEADKDDFGKLLRLMKANKYVADTVDSDVNVDKEKKTFSYKDQGGAITVSVLPDGKVHFISNPEEGDKEDITYKNFDEFKDDFCGKYSCIDESKLKEADGDVKADTKEDFKPTEDDKKMLLDMQHDEIVTIAKYSGYKERLSEPLHEFIDEINKDEANHRDIFGLLSEGKLDDAEKLG